MRETLEKVPGVSVLFTTPLGMRIDEGLGGTPADLSVRIFGPDLDELARLGDRARDLMSGVEGIEDLRLEQVAGLPQLRIAVDREAAARVGSTPGEIVRAVRIGLVGEEFSQVWVGQRRFDLRAARPGRPPPRRDRDPLAADRRPRRHQDPAGPGRARSRRPSARPPCAARRAAAGSRSRRASPAATWAARPRRCARGWRRT